jgi:hypothetical protein
MKKITKHQLSELEELLKVLDYTLKANGAPLSLIRNVEDVHKSINHLRGKK